MKILKFMFEKQHLLQFIQRVNQRILKIHQILKIRKTIIINEEVIIIHFLMVMDMDELIQWMMLIMIVWQNLKMVKTQMLKTREKFQEELLLLNTWPITFQRRNLFKDTWGQILPALFLEWLLERPQLRGFERCLEDKSTQFRRSKKEDVTMISLAHL